MQTEPTGGVSIFVSSAPADQTLQQELKEHLSPLQQEGRISLWADTESKTRAEGEHEVDQQLNTAQIILLLVSPDYLNSDYHYQVEMKRALERFERGEARVIPIIVRPVYWESTPLGNLQVLPLDGKPLATWSDREKGWREIVQMLSHVVDETLQQP
jgi:hypothetical protein